MANTFDNFFSTSFIICFITFYLILLITLSYACYRLGYNRSSSCYRSKYRLIRKGKSSKIYEPYSSQDETLPLMPEHVLEKEKSQELKANMMKTMSERQKDKVTQEERFKNFEPLYEPKTCPKCSHKVNSKKEQTFLEENKENETDSFIECDRTSSPTDETMLKENECSTVLNFETDSHDKAEIIGIKQSVQTVHPVFTKTKPCSGHQQTAVMSEEKPAVISIEHVQKCLKADHQHESKLNSKHPGPDGLLNNVDEFRASEDESKETQEKQESKVEKLATSSDIDNSYINKESYSQVNNSINSKDNSLKQSKDNSKSKDIILNWPTIKAQEQPIPVIPHLRLPEANPKSPKVTQLKKSLIATRVKREINKPITEEKEPFQLIDERLIENEMINKVMSSSLPEGESNLQIKGMIILNKKSKNVNKKESPIE